MTLNVQSSNFRRRFGRLTISILGVIFLVYFIYTFCMQYFSLRYIHVIGVGIRISIDQKKLDKNLLFIHTDQIKKDIMSNNNQIEDISITKQFPDTLVIAVTLRVPYARVSTKTKIVVIDAQGVVLGFATVKNDTLPFMDFGVDDVMDGVKLTNPAVVSGLAILRDLLPIFNIHTLNLLDTSSIRAVYGKTSILFPLISDYSALASTLQTLTARFRMKESMPTSIDLRFDKPILRM